MPAFRRTDIQVTGPVSVKLETSMPQNTPRYIFLLLGPTGSGKSSFIESIAGQGSLGIAGDQLDSVTKEVQAYKLINASLRPGKVDINNTLPIYLIDTPGFADTKLSEMKIVLLLKSWLEENDVMVNHTLYFDRITDIRMNRTRQTSIAIFESLVAGVYNSELTIITTMWDQLCNDRLRNQGNARLKELRDLWKPYTRRGEYNEDAGRTVPGAILAQFYNTRRSALKILDQSIVELELTGENPLALEAMIDEEKAMNTTDFGPLLEKSLKDRIGTLKGTITSYDASLGAELKKKKVDLDVFNILVAERRSAQLEMEKYEAELEDYHKGHPTTPSEIYSPKFGHPYFYR